MFAYISVRWNRITNYAFTTYLWVHTKGECGAESTDREHTVQSIINLLNVTHSKWDTHQSSTAASAAAGIIHPFHHFHPSQFDMDHRIFKQFICLRCYSVSIHFGLLMFHFIPFCDINKMKIIIYRTGRERDSEKRAYTYSIFIFTKLLATIMLRFFAAIIALKVSFAHIDWPLHINILCRNKLNYMCIKWCSPTLKHVTKRRFPLNHHLSRLGSHILWEKMLLFNFMNRINSINEQ